MDIEENESMNFPSSEMNTNSVSVWDPIVSLSQKENFGSDFGIRNQGMLQYQTDSDLGVMLREFPTFGNGSFSEMVGSFGVSERGGISTMRCPQNYSKCKQQVSENGENGKSPRGKVKKRGSESNSPQSHCKGDQSKEISDEKRQKIEHNSATNLPTKQNGKQVKDDSNNAKQDYIHVRARRGQATNSHSLAERVRRERISERMKLLQDLVPGCNKITGKAVMLDEIINYVQSLQQQVEFLSMKLATVNPEINIDIDKILSKELLHMRGGDVAMPGYSPGVNLPHPYHPSLSHGSLSGLPNASPFHQMPQNMWDSEIQSLLQMGFDSNPLINNNLGSSGRPKLDL